MSANRETETATVKRKRVNGNGGLIFNSLSAIVICAALVIGITVFFRVSRYEISGASRYSENEIIDASGVKEGSNLIFMNRAAIENRIKDKLVYVGMVTVTRKLPNTVVIQVHESGTVACVETEGGIWLIDNYCRLLEQCSVTEAENYVRVYGFSVNSPKTGQKITVDEQDKSKIDYLQDLLTALYEADMLGSVKSIDISTSSNAQFDYMDKFRIKLGRDESVEAKLGLLRSTIEALEETDTGTIDLSDPKKAIFSPG